jgi:hypothetical protein
MMAGVAQHVRKGRYLVACFIAIFLLIGDGMVLATGISQGRNFSDMVLSHDLCHANFNP